MQRQTITGILIGFFLGVAITAVSLTLFKQTRPAAIVIEAPPPPATAVPTATPGPLQIFVNGAVTHPEIYALPPGSRVDAAIEAAGGFTVEADTAVVNLALPLQDGMQIYVPAQGEGEAVGVDEAVRLPETAVVFPGTSESSSDGALVNINTADEAALDALPGIGPSTAQNIIAHRDTHGPFTAIEGIMAVTGIGEAKFTQIQSLITVEN